LEKTQTMKKIILLSITIALTSCSTSKSGTAKTMDIVGAGVMHKPVVVDLDVKQDKVEKTVEIKNLTSLENAKNEVVRDLLKERNADILVEPSFYSTTKGSKTELTVYGWTANYKNFRPIEEKDIKFMEVKPSLVQKADVYQPVTEKKKSSVGWIIAGGLIIAGSVVIANTL
jgi:hypothetical protein